jgi:HlyD family secretion protein
VQVEAYPGRIFPGVVDMMEPQAVNQSNVTMFPVIVRLDNRSGLLMPGMNAEVEMLLVERPDVLVVPNNAVVLTQEMAPAASVLGLDPEIELDFSVYSQMAQEAGLGRVQGLTRGRGGGGRAGSPGGGSEASSDSTANTAGDMTDRRAQIQALRAQAESGEISQDSLNAVLASMRGQRGEESGGMPAAGVPAGDVAVQAANPALSGLVNTSSAPRPAVAFVMGPDSTLVPRPVLMGVNDWDNTEILAGLEEGEQVALLGVAQLMAEQEDMRNRMMGRGMIPGMGGPGRGR